MHAGSRNGFITNAKLIFKAGSSSGDYHGQMNSVNFEKWSNEKLLPNLPAKTIVIKWTMLPTSVPKLTRHRQKTL